MNIVALLERAEQCHREVAQEYYNAFSGRQEKLDITAILAKYPDLYSRDTLDAVMALGSEDVPDGRERRFLLLAFTLNYFIDRLKEYSDRLANAEAAAVVAVDEEQIPFRAMPVALANEQDYVKRARMDSAYIAALAELNPLREEADSVSRALVGELGYRNTIDMMEQLALMRIYPLREEMGAFLVDTLDVYEERLRRYAGEAGLEREAVRHADIGVLMRGSRYDELFPADQMLPALARTLQGLGIELNGQSNVTLDLEERPKKSSRAFCIGIEVPHDVRLVLKPHGGQDDYRTLFHEAGHLEFGAHMDPGLSFLFRQHGDKSVHESYAFLLQHLLEDPVWWHEIMGAEADEYIRFARFHRLYFLRRYGAKLNYEVEYYERDGGPELADSYARWLGEGCRVAYPPERYLADFDSGFYVLQYLQAWIWECQLRSYLRDNFGEAWFTSGKAGDFLRELWWDGQKYDVWEIAERLGFGGLDIAPIKEELTA